MTPWLGRPTSYASGYMSAQRTSHVVPLLDGGVELTADVLDRLLHMREQGFELREDRLDRHLGDFRELAGVTTQRNALGATARTARQHSGADPGRLGLVDRRRRTVRASSAQAPAARAPRSAARASSRPYSRPQVKALSPAACASAARSRRASRAHHAVLVVAEQGLHGLHPLGELLGRACRGRARPASAA